MPARSAVVDREPGKADKPKVPYQNVGPMQAAKRRIDRRNAGRKAVAVLRGLGFEVHLTRRTDDAPDLDAVLS